MKNKLLILATSLLVLSLAPLSASAGDGVKDVQRQIAIDRVEHADMFSTIAELRGEAIAMDAQKRGRYAMTGKMLESLGPDAHYALADDLLSDKHFREVRASVRIGWRVGALYALGRARNPEFRSIFTHVLNVEKEPEVLKAAARALGNLQDDAAAKTLIGLASTDGAKADAVLSGMGTCRRTVVASYLASELNKAKSPARVLALTLTLRDVANSWAWKTPIVSKSGEGEEVRAIATKALVQAFMRIPQQESELTKAILIVDSQRANTLIASARKGASEATQKRLDALAIRVGKNPLH